MVRPSPGKPDEARCQKDNHIYGPSAVHRYTEKAGAYIECGVMNYGAFAPGVIEGVVMSVTGGQGAGPSAGSVSRRRPREEAAGSRAVLVRLTEEEFGELTAAAERARMARAAYAAEAALSAARGTAAAPDEQLREALGEVMRAASAGAQDRRSAEPGGREAERDRAAPRRAGPGCAGVPEPRGEPERHRGTPAPEGPVTVRAPSRPAAAVRPGGPRGPLAGDRSRTAGPWSAALRTTDRACGPRSGARSSGRDTTGEAGPR